MSYVTKQDPPSRASKSKSKLAQHNITYYANCARIQVRRDKHPEGSSQEKRVFLFCLAYDGIEQVPAAVASLRSRPDAGMPRLEMQVVYRASTVYIFVHGHDIRAYIDEAQVARPLSYAPAIGPD